MPDARRVPVRRVGNLRPTFAGAPLIGKIAYIFAEADRPVYGPSGHSVHIQELCRALCDAGQDVVIIAASEGAHDRDSAVRVCEVAPRIVSLRRRASRSNTTMPADSSIGQATRSRAASATLMGLGRDIARVTMWKSWDSYFYRKARQVLLRERPDFLYERYVRGISVGARLAREFDLPFILEMNTSFTFPIEWWDEHSSVLPRAVSPSRAVQHGGGGQSRRRLESSARLSARQRSSARQARPHVQRCGCSALSEHSLRRRTGKDEA